MLGTQTVDGRHDRDSIPVSAVRNKYSELTLVVVDSDLQLENMVVHFGNGTKFEPNIKHTFREGQRTRAIELPGPNDRYITSIDLQYSNIPGGGRARVEVWGRDTKKQASGPAAPPPAPVWDSKGWTQLGTATVQGKTGKLDKDTIPVGQRDGKWDEVMLVVIDSDLQMDDVTVVLGDKERFTPKLKHVFKEGQRTQAIALPHGNRFIDHIELTYSNLPGGGNARVEAWGKPAKAK